jgi:hypothetical protein
VIGDWFLALPGMLSGAALGIVVESPQRALEMRAGKARTWNEKPGPQVTLIFIKLIEKNIFDNQYL